VFLAIVPASAGTTFVAPIGNLNSFRYVRYLGAPGTYSSLAELEFDGGKPPAPYPVINAISPATVYAGTAGLTVNITGGRFVAGSTAYWNGTALATTYVSGAVLTASVPASLLTAVGTGTITIANPGAVGGVSNGGEVKITAAPIVSTVALSAPTAIGGTILTAKITLSVVAPVGGVTVTLASSKTAVQLTSPVIVPAGSNNVTVNVKTIPVDASTALTITATANGHSGSANLTVTPPALSTITVSPATVSGGTAVHVTVTTTGKAGPSGISVAMTSSDNTTIAPGSILTILAGTSAAIFTFTPPAVAVDKTVTIKAAALGGVKTAPLTVSAPVLTAFAASTATPHSGQTVTLKATIGSPAPAAGLKVTLASNSASLPVTPGYITIPAGALIGSLVVTPKTVTASTPVTLTATLNATTLTKAVTIAP